MELKKINKDSVWGAEASKLNDNFQAMDVEMQKISATTIKDAGVFATLEALQSARPTPHIGDTAKVGTELPYAIYVCEVAGTWKDSGATYSPTTQIPTIEQTTGDSETSVMSQKAVTDELEAINAVKGELSASITALQEGKVDKEKGKSLIEDEVKECFRVIENEEFIMAVVDSKDKVLYGIYRDSGKPHFPQNDMYHISQSEEFLWVILDVANHPLLGIQQDGTCWAAKAQWLDDIKAIKEVLSSIDETLKTFQSKEDGKGLINIDVADSFFYISNDEYIIAVVDAENRILAGIKYDGKPYFPNHEMYSVITNEEWQIGRAHV